MLKVANVLAIMCAAVAMTATAAELNFDSFLRADVTVQLLYLPQNGAKQP